ncbi:MAG: hypothetical protein V5A57_00595 [Candidatus Paceibacterota bacterium]
MKDKYCEHCWPTKRKSHISTYFNYFSRTLQEKLSRIKLNLSNKLLQRVWTLLLDFLSLIKIVTFNSEPTTDLRNRSLIFWKEAKRRGFDVKQVKILGKKTNFFKFQRQYYEAIPLAINHNIDDKFRIKQLLKKEFPVPTGDCFISRKRGLKYGKKLGFPLVVKPRFGSLSAHATWNITNKEQLKQAIGLARQYQPGFMVEEYLEGSLFRATVLKDKVFVCKKEKANVTGDGESTIKQLIKNKNKNPYRGSTHQKNTTLHEIPINKRIVKNLKEQDLTLNSVPEKDKKVYLHQKIILAQGCDVIELTEEVPPVNKKLFRRAAEVLRADLVGFDFITPDISVPYHQQEFGIIEANSLPYADMHQYPSKGKSQPVAKTAWDKARK